MGTFTAGEIVKKYIMAQILKEIQETEDTFSGFFGKVNKAAVSADGVSVQKLINDITVKTGLSESATLTARKIAGEKTVIPWMEFTTEAIETSLKEVQALAYDKNAEIRPMLVQAVKDAMLARGLHAVAPDSTSGSQVVVETSGDNDGSGRLKLIPKDMTNALRGMKEMKNPTLVLNRDHLIDLQENEETKNRFATLGVDPKTMVPVPYAGIKSVSSDVPVRYTPTKTKRALDAAAAETDRFASVFIDRSNTIWFLDSLFFTMTLAENDTVNEIPKTTMRIYGKFIGAPIEDGKKRAAIIDGRAA